jgi:hypothetical protein
LVAGIADAPSSQKKAKRRLCDDGPGVGWKLALSGEGADFSE